MFKHEVLNVNQLLIPNYNCPDKLVKFIHKFQSKTFAIDSPP